MIGRRFERLVVLSAGPRMYARRHRSWIVRCDCGAERAVAEKSLLEGRTRSCGCLQAELKRARMALPKADRHLTPEYRAWRNMRYRCNSPGCRFFHNYGGRGIRVCERWDSYEAFLEDMGTRPSSRHTLERIDNNGNYEPKNCRWATYFDQSRNRRTNRIVSHRGHVGTLTDVSRAMGLPLKIVSVRLFNGWDLARALDTPWVRRPKGQGI